MPSRQPVIAILFLDQRSLNDRPGIKACLIRAARDTKGLHLPQLAGQSENEGLPSSQNPGPRILNDKGRYYSHNTPRVRAGSS